jgi:hypothetical protein
MKNPTARGSEEIFKTEIDNWGKTNNIHDLKYIFNSLPYIGAIINSERQIIFSNANVLNFLKINSFEELFGLKKGEKIDCIYKEGTPEICNTFDRCKFCGIIAAVSKSLQDKKLIEEECKINYRIDNEDFECYFHVTATPFYINNNPYIILALNDNSDEKKKEILEKIFFHDAINIAGNLYGIIDLMKDTEDYEKLKEFIDIAHNASRELVDDLVAQRQLLEAENKRLEIEPAIVITNELFGEILSYVCRHPAAKNRILRISNDSSHIAFSTDRKILSRVLFNMLKNAVEASEEWGDVEIGSSYSNGNVVIWVKNKSVVPDEVRTRLFKRPVSTKGKNRGIGTYSMKLLTKEYLGGEVSYETDEENGTKFFVTLPAYIKNGK